MSIEETAQEKRIYKETNKLRFVVRDDKKILQQYWDATRTFDFGWGSGPLEEPVGEWRDVPIVVLVEEKEKNT